MQWPQYHLISLTNIYKKKIYIYIEEGNEKNLSHLYDLGKILKRIANNWKPQKENNLKSENAM